MNPQSSTPKYIIIKIEKIKDRGKSYSQQEGKKKITYKENPIIAVSLFLTETLQDRRKWKDISAERGWRGNLQDRIKLSNKVITQN